VATLSLLVALVFPAGERVPALAAANSAGMLVLGGVLLVLVARRCGAGALSGLARAGGVTLLAGTLATLAGVGVRAGLLGTDGLLGSDGWLPVLGAAVVSGVLVTVVYAVVAVLGDRPAARALWRRARSEGGV
jgi:putative peptidoglycan lipid II flippase